MDINHETNVWHSLLEEWLRRSKDENLKGTLYIHGVIDGIYLYRCSQSPDDADILAQIRHEFHLLYKNT